ncbi:hypothetical protein J6590_012679 [Homalodisca vitripennis]|nr:hypothetical protein J6590_012679 [Homalodisca vitripennis]
MACSGRESDSSAFSQGRRSGAAPTHSRMAQQITDSIWHLKDGMVTESVTVRLTVTDVTLDTLDAQKQWRVGVMGKSGQDRTSPRAYVSGAPTSSLHHPGQALQILELSSVIGSSCGRFKLITTNYRNRSYFHTVVIRFSFLSWPRIWVFLKESSSFINRDV